jgi:group I intron endonuclease
MKGYIYKITNKMNQKVYVGQTTRSLAWRWYHHKYPSVKKTLLKTAILEYGAESFAIEMITEIFASGKEELRLLLNIAEKKYINEFNSIYPNGYNAIQSGRINFHTEESKEKIAASKRGKPRPDMLLHLPKIHEKCKKKIICNETGQIWSSVKDCAAHFNVKPKQISRVLRGQRKRLKWQFTFSYLQQS